VAEADLMRRVYSRELFAVWLRLFLPRLPSGKASGKRVSWLVPTVSPDRTDGKLAHLDGLSLSRAWMLEGVAAALPPRDRRRASLLAAARAHRNAGLAAVTGEHYEGGHWLGTFAVYLVSERGLAAGR